MIEFTIDKKPGNFVSVVTGFSKKYKYSLIFLEPDHVTEKGFLYELLEGKIYKVKINNEIIYGVTNENDFVEIAENEVTRLLLNARELSVFDRIITIDEAAALWEIARNELVKLCETKKIISKKFGETWLIDRGQANPKIFKNVTEQTTIVRSLKDVKKAITAFNNAHKPIRMILNVQTNQVFCTTKKVHGEWPLLNDEGAYRIITEKNDQLVERTITLKEVKAIANTLV